MAKSLIDRNSEKRVCLITGASGTLGSSFCARYAEFYDIAAVHFRNNLLVASQDQSFVNPLNLETDVKENAFPVFSIRADLSFDPECSKVIDLVKARYGRLDLLINAAGPAILGPIIGSDELLSSLGYLFQLHVYVPLRLSALAATAFWTRDPADNRRHRRNIVNISSTSGTKVYKNCGQAGYSACKAAVNQLTLHMSQEFAAIGVRVNALAPNSFPAVTSTDVVSENIHLLDESDATGTIVELS